METLAQLRDENRKPTAAGYLAIMGAALDYAERRGNTLANGKGRGELQSSNEGLGWHIALSAWEDAKRGGIDLGSDGLHLLMKVSGRGRYAID